MNRSSASISLIFLLSIIFGITSSDAAFRTLQPVAAPHETWTTGQQTSGAAPNQETEKLARQAHARATQLAREAMQRLVNSWNQGDNARYLSQSFVDRERFITSWDGQVPRDACIRLLAIESAQPLDQDNKIEGNPATMLHVNTRVSVRATTQVEFNDPAGGFQRREGRNEYIFVIRQRISLGTGK